MKQIVTSALVAAGAISLAACGSAKQAATTATATAAQGGAAAQGDSAQLSPAEAAGEVRPGVAIVYIDAEVGKDPLLAELKDMGAEVIYDYRTLGAMAVRLPVGMSYSQAAKRLKKVKGVLGVQPDRKLHLL